MGRHVGSQKCRFFFSDSTSILQQEQNSVWRKSLQALLDAVYSLNPFKVSHQPAMTNSAECVLYFHNPGWPQGQSIKSGAEDYFIRMDSTLWSGWKLSAFFCKLSQSAHHYFFDVFGLSQIFYIRAWVPVKWNVLWNSKPQFNTYFKFSKNAVLRFHIIWLLIVPTQEFLYMVPID